MVVGQERRFVDRSDALSENLDTFVEDVGPEEYALLESRFDETSKIRMLCRPRDRLLHSSEVDGVHVHQRDHVVAEGPSGMHHEHRHEGHRRPRR